jgi:hypothetical protein
MTKEKLDELRAALNSAGFVLLRVDERTNTSFDYATEPDNVEHFDSQSAVEIFAKNRVYIDAVPLFLPAGFVQQ